MKHITLLLLIFGFALPSGASAKVVEFIQDVEILVNGSGTGAIYTGTNDVEIREESPNSNFDLGTGSSSNPEFTVDGSDSHGSGFDAQVLIRFDDIFGSNPWQVPLNSIINSATLFIDVDNRGDTISLVEMNIDWGSEATATWNSLGNGIDGAESSEIIDLSGSLNKEFLDVTSQLAAWSAGADNFGWGFVPTTDDKFFDGVDFDASENRDPTDRPRLTVNYTAPKGGGATPLPEPGTMALLFIGLSGLGFSRRKKRM